MLVKKLEAGTQIEMLDQTDVDDLQSEMNMMTAVKTSFKKSLCYFKLFCKKDRKL